jgi:hypothetical protein
MNIFSSNYLGIRYSVQKILLSLQSKGANSILILKKLEKLSLTNWKRPGKKMCTVLYSMCAFYNYLVYCRYLVIV